MGCTLISERDPSRIAEIQSIEDVEDLRHIHLETLITLDFEMLLGESELSWAEGKPIRFNPDEGMAIFKVNASALKYVVSRAHHEDDEARRAELIRLAKFIEEHGSSDIYELATF